MGRPWPHLFLLGIGDSCGPVSAQGWPELCGGMGRLGAFAGAVCSQMPGCFSECGSGGVMGVVCVWAGGRVYSVVLILSELYVDIY